MPERELIVGFGTLLKFKEVGDVKRVGVVINVGCGNWCSTATLRENEKGEKTFLSAGGTIEDNIDEIIGQMSVQEVFKAAELGQRLAGLKGLSDPLKKILEENSKAKPRILNRSNF